MTTVKFNKTVTAIKGNSIVNFKTKKDFWAWASIQDSFVLDAGHNRKQILNKLRKLDFNLDINDDWGFDFDFRVIAKK
tara:strand:- start:223 stop:456 length:234 start_codon:yes stop_codon:yes gene_type:complete